MPTMTITPVKDFDWNANNMEMQYMTCPRHPGVLYLTKHPYERSVHILAWDDNDPCKCGFSTMMVVPERPTE